MFASAKRTAQRYLVPRIVTSLYYLLRYRCLVSSLAIVQFTRNISLGRGTVVKPFAVIQTNTGKIRIGKKCSINNFVQIASSDAKITLGDYVRIGPGVTILSSSRNYKRKDQLIMDQGFSNADTTIEDDVLIGAGVTILKGCTIGKGAVIAAGSVVTKDVAPDSVVAGIPASVIGQRE
jgi:acetyltransferase-like isoleucine patch superfamily enzyme